MGITGKIFKYLLSFKNRQLRFERDRRVALEETNSILSAYLAYLIEENGEVRIPREVIKSSIGRYKAFISVSGDDYLISVISERKGGKEGGGLVSDGENGSQ